LTFEIKKIIKKNVKILEALILVLIFSIIAFYARFKKNKLFDVALGPTPLINNIYHKMALERYGYRAKTLVFSSYFITDDFDYKYYKKTKYYFFDKILFFYDLVTKYKILYTYFDGTWLFFRGLPALLVDFLIFIEPRLYRFSGLKLVVMPYGSDIQEMNLCPNLLFKNAMTKDYPIFQRGYNSYIKIAVKNWLQKSDHIIAGCDWVYYLHSWDTLLSGHFAVDTCNLVPTKIKEVKQGELIKIFHCPNHKNIKGTRYFQNAVSNLQNQGYKVELVLVQKRPNHEILDLIKDCDIVADQLIIGWYAMTALEAMCFAKPVLCFLDPNLIELYIEAGVLNGDDIPLINCNYKNVESQIKFLLDNPEMIKNIGLKSRMFVEKYHSLDFIGSIFNKINHGLGIVSGVANPQINGAGQK